MLYKLELFKNDFSQEIDVFVKAWYDKLKNRAVPSKPISANDILVVVGHGNRAVPQYIDSRADVPNPKAKTLTFNDVAARVRKVVTKDHVHVLMLMCEGAGRTDQQTGEFIKGKQLKNVTAVKGSSNEMLNGKRSCFIKLLALALGTGEKGQSALPKIRVGGFSACTVNMKGGPDTLEVDNQGLPKVYDKNGNQLNPLWVNAEGKWCTFGSSERTKRM